MREPWAVGSPVRLREAEPETGVLVQGAEPGRAPQSSWRGSEGRKAGEVSASV